MSTQADIAIENLNDMVVKVIYVLLLLQIFLIFFFDIFQLDFYLNHQFINMLSSITK